MSDAISSQSLVAGPGFPRMALGLAWFGSSLGTSALSWLAGGPASWVLLGAAALGFVATGAVVSNRHRTVTLTFSALTSVATIVAGAVVAMLAGVPGVLGVAEAVVVGAVPVVGGLVSLRLTRRARRMAE